MDPDVKHILLVRTDRIGDVVLSLPMLPLLKRQFPNASISVLARRYTRELLDGHSCVHEVLEYENERRPSSLLSVLRLLRERHFDIALLPYPRFRTTLLIALAGIPVRVGTGYRWYSFLLNRKIYEHRKVSKRHEVEYNLTLLRALGINVDGTPQFELTIPEGATQTIDRILIENGLASTKKKFIVLHPGSGGSARDWPTEKFSLLGTMISEKLGYDIIVTGGQGEEELARSVARNMPNNPIMLAGILTLNELAALLRRATAFVSNSTGPLHIAAVMGTPVVAFYPPILPCSPVRWGPYTDKKKIFEGNNLFCPLCRGTSCRSNICMEQIEVEEVFSGLAELLHIALPINHERS